MMRDRLEDAIDQVSAQMTRVAENDAFAARILASLPERSTWFGWLMHSWAPRLAMIAIVVTVGIVWGNRRPRPIPPVASPLASRATVSRPTVLVAAIRELEPNRTKPVEPLEPVEPVEPLELASVDHDRSLPSIAAVATLSIEPLAPVSLPEDTPLTVTPLAIAELPLTAETISPR